MIENAFIPLTFIAGPAILTNACAIMQNSATMRYTTAVTQWREFRASLATGGETLSELYADSDGALALAERRIRLLLHGLNLVYAAVSLFGLSALIGLTGAVLAASPGNLSIPVLLVVGIGGAGVSALLLATAVFTAESRCTSQLLGLQLHRP